MTVLFVNISADDVSNVVKTTGGPVVIFIRAGSYGGGAINILTAAPSDLLNRFSILTNGTVTEDSDIKIDYLPNGTSLKVSLTGSSGASNVFVEVGQ